MSHDGRRTPPHEKNYKRHTARRTLTELWPPVAWAAFVCTAAALWWTDWHSAPLAQCGRTKCLQRLAKAPLGKHISSEPMRATRRSGCRRKRCTQWRDAASGCKRSAYRESTSRMKTVQMQAEGCDKKYLQSCTRQCRRCTRVTRSVP